MVITKDFSKEEKILNSYISHILESKRIIDNTSSQREAIFNNSLNDKLIRKLSLTSVLMINDDRFSEKYPYNLASEQYIVIDVKSITSLLSCDNKMLEFKDFFEDLLKSSMGFKDNKSVCVTDEEAIGFLEEINSPLAKELKLFSFTESEKKQARSYIENGGHIFKLSQ